MGIGPGEDWAMAVISSISSSLNQPSSSENFRFIREAITKPPPKVKALRVKVAVNNCHKIRKIFCFFSICLFSD